MLIMSDYNFDAHIHLFRYLDLNIVLDVNTGAIHTLSDFSFRLLEKIIFYKGDTYRAMEDFSLIHSFDDITEVMYEIMGCWEDGSLFTDEAQIELDYRQMPLKALCLNVAHVCNMKCKYCFAGQGSFGMETSLMPPETAVQAIEFLLQQSQDSSQLEIDFFGGEPLLNASTVRQAVAYAREKEKATGKNFRFTLTTNTLLLDEDIMDFIIAEQIGVILSLDGRPETNDRYRIINDPRGSYHLIIPKIKQMLQREPISYYIRGTFTHENLDFAQDVRHIIDLGFFHLSLEPAVGTNPDWAIRAEDLPQVVQEYQNLTRLLLSYHEQGIPVEFFNYNLDLQKGPCLAKRSTGCGAGVEYLVVAPNGDLYPCHQFVGQPDMLMGNLNTGITAAEVENSFISNTLFDKPVCQKCWARFFCGGGCHANNYYAKGHIAQPNDLYCQLHRQRVEGAIYLDLKKRVQI